MTRPVFYLTLFLFFLSISVTSGQTKSELREKFYEAEAFVLYEEWQEALPGYRELLQLFPDNYNYKYRIGMCYLNMPGQKELALGYLQDAVQNINPSYKEGKFRETLAPYDAIYYLANAYLITNQLDKAVETFRSFYNGMDRAIYDTTIVKLQIEACINAKQMMNIPLYMKEENLGENINDNFSAFNPVLSADESVMVFSKKLQYYTAPYFTRKINGEWTPPQPLIEQLLIDEGLSTGLSADGTELYIYKSDSYDGNIYVSNYAEGRWSPAVKLNENINTNYWESHASVSADGKTLYFTSNRKGGYGGLDIYISKKDSSGSWGTAVNLGPEINTPYNEDTPFLDITNKTLFFSSRGHFSMGGHDIFYSSLMENGKWSTPVNMGSPVNTTDDDLFYSPVGEGFIAYQSKYEKDGYGEQDIYRLEVFSDRHPRIFNVRGVVTLSDLLNDFKDNVRVSALGKLDMDTIVVLYSDPATGEYEFEVPHGEYNILYESPGSEKKVTELVLALTHPGDNVVLPRMVLAKNDFIAELKLVKPATDRKYSAGDTLMIELAIEPSSILKVEHRVNGNLVGTDEFIIYDDHFTYEAVLRSGENRFTFTSRDRFNNTEMRELSINVSNKPVAHVVEKHVDTNYIVPVEVQKEPVTDKITRDKDLSIDSMRQAISQATGNDPAMLDAIVKTSEKSIRNAGEWLGTLYSVAIEDGTDKEIMLRLIAAMTADENMTAQDYLKALEVYNDGKLRDFIANADADQAGLSTPEDVINWLVNNSSKGGYTTQELFVALARMISVEKKSAADILDYFNNVEKRYLWILWVLLGATLIT
ncbi:MAG: tetratricopeptide repeat protein, partial [Bacteroidia bacterium]